MHAFRAGAHPVGTDRCRELASMAYVESTYFVTTPRSQNSGELYIDTCFEMAFEVWRQSPGSTLSCVFDWEIADESGSGTARFEGSNNLIAAESFVTQTINNLIIKEIADQLFSRVAGMPYAGRLVAA
jgi:hypothetical protein